MPIAIPASLTSQTLAPESGLLTAGGQKGLASKTTDNTTLADTGNQEASPPAANEQTRVTLASTGEPPPAQRSITYAEIWKDGVKVAVVDSSGGVSSQNGAIAPMDGASGANGMMLAARRVAQITAAVGGQVIVGGQALDAQTIATRAKLQMAYGQFA
jgi:hypothetical protein